MANLIERHAQKIVRVVTCFGRLVLQGTRPSVAYPQAMATESIAEASGYSDYAKQFALPFREAIRAHTERVAAEEGVEIEFIQRMKNFRKKIAFSRSYGEQHNDESYVAFREAYRDTYE